MKKILTPVSILVLSASLLVASACTKKEAAPESAPATTAPAAPASAAAPASKEALDASKATASLELATDGDAIAYDKKEFTIKAGEIVKLTFKNNSTSSAMQHNVVITLPGKESEVDQAGITSGAENGWIPKDHPSIIAHTKLVDPGQTDTIVFRAPAAGKYAFLCTYPGHSASMRGMIIVK